MDIKDKGPHLDHLLRQTRLHHAQLSAMADVKAGMLLTTASVVITLAVPYIRDPNLKWGALVMMAFCLLTITLATYSVMPKLPLSIKQESEVKLDEPGFNLLFFGDFLHMDYKNFANAMEAMMSEPNRVYEAQVREIYTLGQFLARKKYHFVRLAYLAFIIGLIASGTILFITNVIFV